MSDNQPSQPSPPSHASSAADDDSNGSSNTNNPLPPPPNPSSDPRLLANPSASDAGNCSPDSNGLFDLKPVDALKMLSAGVERLVVMTGDIPPTPPPKSPTVPHMSGMLAEKENIVRTHSDKNLARLRKQAELEALKMSSTQQSAAAATTAEPDNSSFQTFNETMSARTAAAQHKASGSLDGVQLKKPATPAKPEPYIIVGADSQPVNLQHGAITRKFYSKNEPPISISQYLLRLHQFCPMSTAVYLATSLYIHRLAVEERAIPVTRRNAHRLVLAGLRVAMKALEDLSYSHAKMSRVGGVSETELARLEISFCFLTSFELVVDKEILNGHMQRLNDGTAHRALDLPDVPTLRLTRKPREVAPVAG